MNAVGLEHLSSFEQLEELSLGIHSLENFDFLSSLPRKIKSLTLGPTKSKKPRLDGLDRFQSLRKLCVAGQQNGIGVVGELQTLEEVSLCRISTANVEYVSKLPQLWSLDIKLGGIESLSAIAGNEKIKRLELWRIRGLSDIGVISSLIGLQYLFLQELRNISSVPDLSRLTKLRRLYLENMKGLTDVSAIRLAPALEQFIHVAAQNIELEQYMDVLDMPTLREVLVGFGNNRKNQEFQILAAKSGKGKYCPSRFVFR
jgi:hypothetical protein